MTAELSATVAVIEDLAIPLPGDYEALVSLVLHALMAEAQTGDWEVSIALISDDELRRLHRDFMGLDTVTDIMTFPLGDVSQGGDIAISVERAVERAPEFGMTAWDEICFLAVHGVLHLTGWEDRDDESRGRMLSRQTEIIGTWRPSYRAGSS